MSEAIWRKIRERLEKGLHVSKFSSKIQIIEVLEIFGLEGNNPGPILYFILGILKSYL